MGSVPGALSRPASDLPQDEGTAPRGGPEPTERTGLCRSDVLDAQHTAAGSCRHDGVAWDSEDRRHVATAFWTPVLMADLCVHPRPMAMPLPQGRWVAASALRSPDYGVAPAVA